MKNIKPFLLTYAFEMLLLISMGVAVLIMLGTFQILNKIDTLLVMIKTSIIVSVIVIPVESIMLYLIIKKYGVKLYMLDNIEVILVRILYMSFIAFIIMWFIHSDLHGHVAENILGYSHGSDEYMLWGRPGGLIIFPAAVASCIIHATLSKLR